MQQGNIFVISAPSGAGKSSLVRELKTLNPTINVSISHTTRTKRNGEIEGKDYYFIDKKTFNHMLQQNTFIEHAKVFGNYYGTSKANIEDSIKQGHDIILEIDWQGAKQVKEILPQAILIFILPPSIDELKKRLELRKTDSEEVIANRLNSANDDISHAKDFDFLVINNNFATAVKELQNIIKKHRGTT